MKPVCICPWLDLWRYKQTITIEITYPIVQISNLCNVTYQSALTIQVPF